MRQPTRGPETDELTVLLDSVEPELQRLLVRFRIPAQDSGDLLQDAIVLFLEKRNRITSPGAWLLSVLKNRCLHYWRARRRRLLEAIDTGLLEEMAGEAPDEIGRRDLAHDLSGALSSLPGRCRTVLRLRYGLECEGPEIARSLGYKPGTVRQVTLRCLSALSRQLLSSGFAPREVRAS